MCDKAVYRTVRATPFLLNKLNCPNLGQVDKRKDGLKQFTKDTFWNWTKKIGQNKTLKKIDKNYLDKNYPDKRAKSIS